MNKYKQSGRVYARFTAVLLCALFLFTACGAQNQANTSETATVDNSPKAVGTDSAPAAQSEYATRVKLRANITTTEPLTDNAMYEWFSEKFQTDMEYIPILFGERHEKARI
ncbi:MAG: hypothetical protein LBB94_00120 [Clostridiales bacterium]|jgi:hypothetical protein|nr:hypothetical protein [Clostridiales bacterium]